MNSINIEWDFYGKVCSHAEIARDRIDEGDFYKLFAFCACWHFAFCLSMRFQFPIRGSLSFNDPASNSYGHVWCLLNDSNLAIDIRGIQPEPDLVRCANSGRLLPVEDIAAISDAQKRVWSSRTW